MRVYYDPETGDILYTSNASIEATPEGVFIETGSDALPNGLLRYRVENGALVDRYNEDALRQSINDERDRRLEETPYVFDGVTFQFNTKSRENIMGAAASATIAITMNGAQAGDLNWHGETTPFVFLALDNTPVQMDAPTVIRFGQEAAKLKSKIIFAARRLKDLDPIPANFTDDVHWT